MVKLNPLISLRYVPLAVEGTNEEITKFVTEHYVGGKAVQNNENLHNVINYCMTPKK